MYFDRANDYWVAAVCLGYKAVKQVRSGGLRWNEVDLDAGIVAVYRSLRATADTKTPKSLRVLPLPQLAVPAPREHLDRQAGDRLLAGVSAAGRW
jgi:hypothetical protein